MRKFLLFLSLLTTSVFFTGCQTSPRSQQGDFEPLFAKFYLEAPEDTRLRGRTETITLPISDVQIDVDVRAVFVEWDITQVELVDTRDGPVFAFRLTRDAARDFMRDIRERDRQRRLVVIITADDPSFRPIVGAAPVVRSFSGGIVYMYLEIPDERAPEIARSLDMTSEAIQDEIAGRR
ncbi:MAG: hypothetical protein JJT75_01845 [Opitutales bacterium]|nr:hypothetical protein [Opitutales bacterium]MCH8540632.1 hypothetical protein [Opitutales bacterium]